jgi:hypothetical protein
MLVVRQKDNHLKILKSGYVSSGGLGEFDSSIYEEIEIDELPEGWEQVVEKPIANGKDLVLFIEKAFERPIPTSEEEAQQIFEERTGLQALFTVSGIKGLLESAPSNPIPKWLFDVTLKNIETNPQIDAQTKTVFIGLAQQWAELVRFQ